MDAIIIVNIFGDTDPTHIMESLRDAVHKCTNTCNAVLE
jgi:hypothetical protein